MQVGHDARNGRSRSPEYAFEAATLYTLRRSLKSGSIAVEYSFAYRSRESLLMPQEEWEKNKGKYYKALGMPRSPDKFLDNLREQLQSGLYLSLTR